MKRATSLLRGWNGYELVAAGFLFALSLGCPPPGEVPPDDSQQQTPDDGQPKAAVWSRAFDATGVGALSAVWGTSPTDVFVVGGTPDLGEVYHFDGSRWQRMSIPSVPLLVWVYGFAADNVYAVGVGGGAIHYDGAAWTALDSGTTEDLWGIWGRSSDDMWIVGGDVGSGEPVLLHFDGRAFRPMTVPTNDRNATSLFKVWGISGKTLAVGERGLVLEYFGTNWIQVPAGAEADEDFVSLWGISGKNIVAVGGRSGGRIAVYDGNAWTTTKPAGVPGLNGVFMASESQCVIGGANGYVATFDPQTGALTQETSDNNLAIHAVWGDGNGRTYAVGGRFASPYQGVALVRTLGDPGFEPVPPENLVLPNDCNKNGLDDDADIAAGTSADCNGNGVPDSCEPDRDGDGVIDDCDGCPDDPNKTAAGDCGCGNAETDSDGDGTPDCIDDCPNDPVKTEPGDCGCGAPDADSDGDGVLDCVDQCPGEDDHADRDGDGTPDGCDLCPDDPAKIHPGNNGCGVAEDDRDGDGVPDGADGCPDDPDKVEPGDCGCGTPETDSDHDGTSDCNDGCPNDPNKTAPGDCGCGIPDTDSDNDGVPNCNDGCPGDPNKTEPGDCGCGNPDTDVNHNGISDCLEDCLRQCDCDLGYDCDGLGSCVQAGGPDLEVGTGTPYAPLCAGGDWVVFAGIQGFVDAYFSLRATGFPPDAAVTLDVTLTRLSDGQVLGGGQTVWPMVETSPGINELTDVYLFVFSSPCGVCDRAVRLDVTITDFDTGTITASWSHIMRLVVDGYDCQGCP